MRRRLVIAIAGVAAVAVLLLAVPLAIVLQRTYRDEDLLRLQRDTVAATRGIDLSARRSDPIELPRSAANLTVYDRAGRRVAGSGPPAAPAVVRSVLRTGRPADDAHGGDLFAAVPLLVGEHVVGAVRAARPDTGAAQDTRSAWLVLGAIAAAIIASATVAALVLGRRLARPLERLAVAARRLGDGDFSVRAPRTNVAEVDAVRSALDITAQRLDDLVSRERAFTTDASHQLRTPLAALRLELESLELRDGDDAEVASALAQVDRLQATIDTLLSVARRSQRPGDVSDLAEMLDDVESRWRPRLAEQARPLRVRATTAESSAVASRPVVDEILDVLIDNAQRHGAGAIGVTLRERGGWLVIDVADEGRGFAGEPEGIGLSLARSLAHAEGGRLVVTSAGPSPVLTLLLRAASADCATSRSS